jgi:hypothetical protein
MDKYRTAYLALAVLALSQGGCLLLAAGAAGGAAVGYAYCKGKVCEAYNAGWDDAWAATHTALAELALPVLGEERIGGGGNITSRAPGGDRIHITVDPTDGPGPGAGPWTRVCVRVATFGDYGLSERILGQVSAHLVDGSVRVPVPPGQPVPAAQSPAGPPVSLQPPAPLPRAQSDEPPLLAPAGPPK